MLGTRTESETENSSQVTRLSYIGDNFTIGRPERPGEGQITVGRGESI